MEGLFAGRRPSFRCLACSSHPGSFACKSCLILHRQSSLTSYKPWQMICRTLHCASLRS